MINIIFLTFYIADFQRYKKKMYKYLEYIAKK